MVLFFAGMSSASPFVERAHHVDESLYSCDRGEQRGGGDRGREERFGAGERPYGHTDDVDGDACLTRREPHARSEAERLGLGSDVRDEERADQQDKTGPEEQRVPLPRAEE